MLYKKSMYSKCVLTILAVYRVTLELLMLDLVHSMSIHTIHWYESDYFTFCSISLCTNLTFYVMGYQHTFYCTTAFICSDILFVSSEDYMCQYG